VLFLSKQTSILKILYPTGVEAEDICEVYETVLPKIRQLVDGVGVGYTRQWGSLETHERVPSAKMIHVDEDDAPIEDTVPDAETPPDEDGGVNIEPEEDDPVEIPLTEMHDIDATPDDHISDTRLTFLEAPRHESFEGWHAEEYNKCKYFRAGDNIVIRIGNSRIDTTWTYLCTFFDDLADETKMNEIRGINGPKRTALTEFYDAHPNFACEIVKWGSAKILKKVDVRVGMATHGEAERSGISGYNVMAY